MADNTLQNGTSNIATDDLATINGGAVGTAVQVQRNKVGYGSDGDFRDVDITHGIPIQPAQSSTGTLSNPSSGMAGTASFTVLASNTARRHAVFFNDTNVDVLLGLSATTVTGTAYTVRVRVGAYYELPGDSMVYTGIVLGLPVAAGTLTATAASSGSLLVTELT